MRKHLILLPILTVWIVSSAPAVLQVHLYRDDPATYVTDTDDPNKITVLQDGSEKIMRLNKPSLDALKDGVLVGKGYVHFLGSVDKIENDEDSDDEDWGEDTKIPDWTSDDEAVDRVASVASTVPATDQNLSDLDEMLPSDDDHTQGSGQASDSSSRSSSSEDDNMDAV